MNPTAPSTPVIRRIKRIAPLQLGKMLAILYGIMGLLFAPFFLLMTLVAPHVSGPQRIGMMTFGLGFAVAAPFFYAAMGFIFGAVAAVIYNVVARWVGGIEVEVE